MHGHLRISSPWSQLAIFLGLFGAAFFIYSLIIVVVVQANGYQALAISTLDWKDPKVVSMFKVLQALSSIVIFLLPALIFAFIVFRGKYARFLGFQKAEKQNMYVLGVLVMLLALPFVFWLGELNRHVQLPQWMKMLESDAATQMEAFLKINKPIDVVINVVIIALFPAICEELCFRSVLQRIMINICRNPVTGIIVTGFLFSALHFQFEGFLPRMFLGIVLGTLYWYSGSIWTSILAHFINNAVQVIIVSYAPRYVNENPAFPVLLALASGLAVAAILYFYRKQSTITYSKVYDTHALNEHNQFIA
ncbi:MAG: CPBP family intramembrane metalloprotease [Chitinophagaceae bacterium]|nr:CPBP family intramembrane metalloprotease [Chitinophagaceae bacterium]